MNKWEIKNEMSYKKSKFSLDTLEKILLSNRKLNSKKEIDDFFNPSLQTVTISSVNIDTAQVKKTIDRIQKAIKNKEQVVVFGDYDVDGVCGSAILWETLNEVGAKVLPYIPHRIDEGYGLSVAGIDNLNSQTPNTKLIITVDNGIVAHKAVEYANSLGIDVIITDHHVTSEALPNAYSVVHTTKLCGTSVAWMLCQQLRKKTKASIHMEHLGLVALATIADLVPLLGANRVLTVFGLKELRTTKRIGIQALCKEAGIPQEAIEIYQIGHVLAPRLNAMGRLENAMDSLRLLCTKDYKRAELLAAKLGSTNKDRQVLTAQTVLHALSQVDRLQKKEPKKLLFIAHKSYQPGVIGLVAGKLVEQYYRPSIVVSIGETYSKASARSVHGFNIIEFIRKLSNLLVDAGGHPMAAGFTIETAKLSLLQKAFDSFANEHIDDNLLSRSILIDCELPVDFVNEETYGFVKKFAPFGMQNPEPTFVARHVLVQESRLVGKEGKHLKLWLKKEDQILEAIAFGKGDMIGNLSKKESIDIVYCIQQEVWNGKRKLQLRIKDVQ